MNNYIEIYYNLGLRLYNLAIDYEIGKISIDEILENFKKIFKIEQIGYGSNVIVFEGERCSGKDTIISALSKKNVQKICVLKRVVDNLAWQALNYRKQNCYFKMECAVMSVLLWLSDLSFRISSWIPLTYEAEYCLVNRYTLSLLSCILSTYEDVLEKEKIYLISKLLQIGISVFPKASKTIILDTDINTILYRMKNGRNRAFSESEFQIAQRNLKRFYSHINTGYYHVNANQNIEMVLNDVIVLLNWQFL